MKKIKTMHLKNILLAVVFGVFGVLAAPQMTSAQYYQNGANLIDNAVFRNDRTMSRTQVQRFLEDRRSGLKDRSFLFNCYGQDSQERQIFTALGAPCDQEASAADIIYFTSRAYGINPQVTLAQLQKEQSLITSQNPSQWQINQAMGYNCPTSGHCNDESGFFYQLDHGVWVLRFHFERARGNMTWWTTHTSWTCGTEKNLYKPNLYPGTNVRFYDQQGVHYRTYRLANAATSSMYCYTPHAYNNPEGLFGRPPYGDRGMYYSGSYNFVNAFFAWFGSPFGERNGVYRLFNSRTNNHLFTTSARERDRAVDRFNFRFEGVAFRVCSINEPGRPVYRLYNPVTGRHFFTPSKQEADRAAQRTNFQKEGTPLRACATGRAVYRLYSAREEKHFYTTSKTERDNLRRNTSFVYEGVGFRVK